MNELDTLSNKNNFGLVEALHKLLVSLSKDVEFRVFPIYIRYTIGDRIIAVLYFSGKTIESDQVEIGLNTGSTKKPDGFSGGEHMKYPGINCSIKVGGPKPLKKELFNIVKLIKTDDLD